MFCIVCTLLFVLFRLWIFILVALSVLVQGLLPPSDNSNAVSNSNNNNHKIQRRSTALYRCFGCMINTGHNGSSPTGSSCTAASKCGALFPGKPFIGYGPTTTDQCGLDLVIQTDKGSAVYLSHNDPLHIALNLRPNAFLKEEVNKKDIHQK